MAVSDILQGPVKIYYANYGTTAPADTVAAGGAWPAGWTALGYTKGPLSVKFPREFTEHEIQESLASIGRQANSEEFVVETVLAEFNLSELALQTGGTFSQTAAGAGQPAKDEIVAGDETRPDVKAWGFEGDYISAAGNTHPIRLFVWRATSEFGVELEFGKAETTGVPMRIKALADMTKAAGLRLFKIQKITAPAT